LDPAHSAAHVDADSDDERADAGPIELYSRQVGLELR
jgi:hypothetical protein